MPDAVVTADTDAGQQSEPTPPDMDTLLKEQRELKASITEREKFNETLKAENAKYRERERLRKEEQAAETAELTARLAEQGKYEELAKARETEAEALKAENTALEARVAEMTPRANVADTYEKMAEDQVAKLKAELTEQESESFSNLYPDFDTMSRIDQEDRLRRYMSMRPTAATAPPLGGTGNPRKQPPDNAAYEAAAGRGDTEGMMKIFLGR